MADYLPCLGERGPSQRDIERKPYVSMPNAMEQLEQLRSDILESIGLDSELGGVTFCDVSAGHIQVNCIKADEPSYVHFHIPLAYDFSNIGDVCQQFCDTWAEQRGVSRSAFYREGEKYGWD